MAIRMFWGLLICSLLTPAASAQFYSLSPRGFAFGGYPPPFPPAVPLPRAAGGVSIRSPFFQMDLSPYGGRYSTPYSSFRVPHPADPRVRVMTPPASSDLYPRGLRDPRYVEPIPETESFDSFQPYEGSAIQEPAPVPPPQYDIPSFSEVFPDESADPVPSSVKIANRLQRAVDRLTASIQNQNSNGVWSNYLRLDDVVRFSSTLARFETNSAEDSADLQSLAFEAESLLVNFDAVVASNNLGWLKNSPGFDDIRATLRDITQYANGMSSAPQTDATPVAPPFRNEPTTSDVPEAEQGYEDLPAPPAKPINKPQRVFRAEL